MIRGYHDFWKHPCNNVTRPLENYSSPLKIGHPKMEMNHLPTIHKLRDTGYVSFQGRVRCLLLGDVYKNRLKIQKSIRLNQESNGFLQLQMRSVKIRIKHLFHSKLNFRQFYRKILKASKTLRVDLLIHQCISKFKGEKKNSTSPTSWPLHLPPAFPLSGSLLHPPSPPWLDQHLEASHWEWKPSQSSQLLVLVHRLNHHFQIQ